LHVFFEARGLRRSGACGFLVVDGCGASRATMVLLPKQVHLQKDVGAVVGLVGGRVRYGSLWGLTGCERKGEGREEG
jgi:hypothetical protein